MNILRYDEIVDIFGGHHKTGLFCGVISIHLRLFLRSRYRIGIFFWVAKFQIFFGVCLIFLIFFCV